MFVCTPPPQMAGWSQFFKEPWWTGPSEEEVPPYSYIHSEQLCLIPIPVSEDAEGSSIVAVCPCNDNAYAPLICISHMLSVFLCSCVIRQHRVLLSQQLSTLSVV